MPAEPVIQTHELTKEYRHPFFTWVVRARALTDLTMQVRRGEVFGLLGPNGSGKSTTIKLALGLLFPSRGQVSVFGRRPDDAQIKGRIGFLPEESYLYRFLDAEETLDFYGRLFSLAPGERKRRADELLDLTGLRAQRHRPIAEFSKGMQRRIGLAQSLINDPDLVIMDEPTTGLDPIGTREIKDLILELKRKGKTIVLSSHLLADVEDVCDRVVILYGGRKQAEGTMDELLQREDRVQLTASMDDATVEAVKRLIRERRGDGTDIRVEPPIERLEQFFLRVVRDAQQQQLDTSGVSASRGRLDFLSDTHEDGTTLLERLTQADGPDTKTGAPEARPASVPSSASSVLDSLATPAAAAQPQAQDEPEPAPDASESTAAPREAVNRSILDKLTRDDDGT